MGPLVAVLLPRELAPEQVSRIPLLLRRSSGIERCVDDLDAIPAGSGSLGTYSHPTICRGSFWTSLVAVDPDNDTEDRAPIEAALGWWPAQAIQMSAGVNDAPSHRILGRSMYALVRRFGGVVDMMGSITPPLPPNRRRLPDDQQHSLEEVSAFVHGFPGTVHEWLYEKEDGRVWVHHFVDGAFMRAWLRHPGYHLVK